MKKIILFLLGVSLAMGSSVCAMNKEYSDLKKEASGLVTWTDPEFNLVESKEARGKYCAFWNKGKPSKESIEKMTADIKDENVTWRTFMLHSFILNETLSLMIHKVFCDKSNETNLKENMEANKVACIRLVGVTEFCLSELDKLWLNKRDGKAWHERNSNDDEKRIYNSLLLSSAYYIVCNLMKKRIDFIKKVYDFECDEKKMEKKE